MKVAIPGCIFLLFAIGCRKTDNSPGNQNATDIFPNKIGDTWLYHVNDTTIYDNPGLATTMAEYDMTISVIESVQLPEGIEANVWVYNYPGGADTNYVFQKDDSIRFFNISQLAFSMYNREYDKQYIIPISLHNSWQYTAGSAWEVTVDPQSNIIVGQNLFNNGLHIYGYAGMPDKGFLIDEWVVDNVGVVKRYLMEQGIGGVNHHTKWSLVSYHLK